MGKILKKEDLNKFLYKLKSKNELISPVKIEDVTRFEIINYISQISLERIPTFSPKKFFLPSKEDIFYFPESRFNIVNLLKREKDKIIFGLRFCDMNAIAALDKMLLGKDHFYTQRREKITIIGLKCEDEVEKNCFCTSMNLKYKGDLFFHDIGDSYYIEVNSDKGLKLVSRLKDYYYDTEKITTFKHLLKKDLEIYTSNNYWSDLAKRCTSCGACTSICPTCNCFKIIDSIELDMQKAKRTRELTSCEYSSFWKDINGNELISEKTDRFKHRIFHKLVYFKKKYGIDMCTGCGRCISNCPQNIDFVEKINELR